MTNTAEFTNNSGKTVLVLSAMSDSNTSPKHGYEETLTILTFDGGETTLDSGKSSTLNLPDNQTVITLLISNPATLFPILSVGETLDYSASGSGPIPYKPIIVSTSDVTAINQALAFRQNIMANPSSVMAEAFQAALTQAQSLGSPAQIVATMDAFFQGYPSFSQVTYAAYEAIESYLKTFALLWVQPNVASANGQGAVYYIYSAPDADQKGAKSEGTIQATQKSGASGTADPTDYLSGYTVELNTGNNSLPIPLLYSNGVFYDSETGSVSLIATYSYQGRFTGDTSQLQFWPILTGTFLGKQVMAIPLAPESGFANWWSSLSFMSLFNYFMGAMGLWMAVDFLKTKLSSKKKLLEKDQAENQGNDPNPQQQQQADNIADEAAAESGNTLEQQGQRVSGDPNFQVPESSPAIEQQITQVRSTSADAYEAVATDNLSGTIEQTGNLLSDIAAIENTPALNQAGENLAQATEALQNGNIAEANVNIQSANANLATAVQDLQNQISQEATEAYNNEINAIREAAEDAYDTSEEGDNARDGSDPEGVTDPVFGE